MKKLIVLISLLVIVGCSERAEIYHTVVVNSRIDCTYDLYSGIMVYENFFDDVGYIEIQYSKRNAKAEDIPAFHAESDAKLIPKLEEVKEDFKNRCPTYESL